MSSPSSEPSRARWARTTNGSMPTSSRTTRRSPGSSSCSATPSASQPRTSRRPRATARSTCAPGRSRRSQPAGRLRPTGQSAPRSASSGLTTASGCCSSALLRSRKEQVVAAVLAAADEDWSGSPLAKAVAEFLDARVARGERLSAGDFGRLSPGSAAPSERDPRSGRRRDEGGARDRLSSSGSASRSTSTSSRASAGSSIRLSIHRRQRSARAPSPSTRSSRPWRHVRRGRSYSWASRAWARRR